MAQGDGANENEPLLSEWERGVSEGARGFWHSFSNFALQDSVLEVAIGLIIAAAFTKIVESFTSDLLLPFVSLLPFFNRQLAEKFAVLRGGPRYESGHGQGYKTLQQALDDGAVVFAYGSFLDRVVNFFAVALSIFGIVYLYSWAAKDPSVIKETVKCKYCRKRISIKAKRCINCTSWLDGREDRR